MNNYILYRDTVDEMMEVYDRNDVYEAGRDVFSPTKMSSRLPVMIVTGDIPTLENTSDKDTQIVVDIEYTNLQDPTRSFRMVGAAMRPQGTSSMGYPKKNFRIYTQKLDSTIVYDSAGNIVADKLYAFKQGAQPVNCWCLKADYAESSGTHNTGIARLWNEALYNAQIDGEYKLRTEAQSIAAQNGYEYDVRTTIDGFPILLFYRPSANDDVIFIGKYNFNNDKSTESVFGFKGIPNFDNTYMQCWEVLNNGNPLALFTTTENFDTMWSEAFESRYPDTKTPDISGLKAFAEWMSTVTRERFITEKWAHMDVYKMAAYWVYLMRHAAADQFVKNAMFTSEDGIHFYYILYDNDTINGLVNTGHLTIKPTDNRQTVDISGSYVFAGHDSRLWNMLESDEEFIQIVSVVDNALYSAGISYNNTIRIFDEEQADKWVEKVYNQDATYKYISPYVDRGIDNLFMLQGKRDLHRRWWLAKRFSIYDAKYVSGQYKSLSVELKCINGTPTGQKFTVTAGYPLDYGYGINNLPRKFGVPLEVGESYTFSTSEVVNLGDPIRIYGAPNIAELDLSKMADRLAVVTISNVYEKALGTRLTKLVVGSPTANNMQVNEISGLRQAIMLDYLDVQGMQALTSLDLSAQLYFKTLKAHNSGIASVTFAKGAPVERLELPSSMRVLSLEQLPLLDGSNIIMENMSNVQHISIKGCPNVSNDFSFVYNWYSTKTTPDAQSTLIADNVVWENVHRDQFHALAQLKVNGGTLDLKGKVSIPNATLTSIRQLKAIFGDTAFYPDSDFYIEVPPVIEISASKNSIWEKESLQLEYELYPVLEGDVVFSLVNGRKGCSINSSTGLITTTETALDTSTITARATFTSTDGKVVIRDDFDVEVKRRIYPTEVSISGATDPYDNQTYTLNVATSGVNGDYNVSWDLQGGLDNYFSIISSDNSKCILEVDGTAPDTTGGMLIVTVKRRFDGASVASAALSLNHTVKWPENVVIVGENNPIDGLEYTWKHSNPVVTGDYYTTWKLDGNVTSYLSIASSNTIGCTLKIDKMPMEQIGGRLILTVYKSYNDEVVASNFRGLSVHKEGVIITDWSNASIQAVLFNAGLVANEKYTLKSEAEAITAAQLQPGTSASTSIFYAQRSNITTFNEFQYFIGVTYLAESLFDSHSKLSNITLPPTVTEIRSKAFNSCSKITSLSIPASVSNIHYNAFNGCHSLDLIVHANNATYSDVSGVLYNKEKTEVVRCVNDSTRPSCTIQSGVTRIRDYAFYYCSNLNSVTIPEGVTSIGSFAFNSCANLRNLVLPSTLTDLSGMNIFAYCSSITEVVIPDKVTSLGNNAFTYCSALTAVTIPASVTSIGAVAFAGCTKMNTLVVNRGNAPSINANSFGNSASDYTGCKSGVSNKLRVPINATGYETGYWLDPLQSADKCNFHIHGKLTITSNRSDAQFNVTYTTESDTLKTEIVGVGTWYLNDIKYSTSITIAAIAISGYNWQEQTKTFTYSKTANTADFNAYIYPSSVSISGDSAIRGGNSATYTAAVSPSNADIGFTYSWSLSSSANASISPNGDNCIIVTQPVEIEENLTITCVVTTTDGRKVENNFAVLLQTGPSLITATYNITTTSAETTLIYNSNIVISYMEIDGVEVAPSSKYLFPNKGIHTVVFELSRLDNAFYSNKNLVTLDLSQCNPSKYNKITSMCYSCTALTSVNFGDRNWNLTSQDNSSRAFSGCSLLEYAHFPSGITAVGAAFFQSCKKLTSLVVPDSVRTMDYGVFDGCTNLNDLTLLSSSLSSLGSYMFRGCVNLKTIKFMSLRAPTISATQPFGSSNSDYTGRNTYNTGENKIYVPVGGTGYETGLWLNPLCDASKCGFTLSKTL